MSTKGKVLATAATALLLAGITVAAGTTRAHATQQQICSGSLCMNDWNGTRDGSVKGYAGGNTHEDFYFELINRCNGSYKVLSKEDNDPINCPFSDADLDFVFEGDAIGQVVYAPYGECVGGNSFGDAVLAGCNLTSNGMDGGPGTVVIKDFFTCGGGSLQLIDRAESDEVSTAEVASTNGSGNPILLNVSEHNGSCWTGT